MNREESHIGEHWHAQAYVNAVMATLGLLTGSVHLGMVSATEPYHPNTTPERAALLKGATAMQTEVSLSIYSSDPLVKQTSQDIQAILTSQGHERPPLRAVEMIDSTIHDWIDLLDGRADDVRQVAHALIEKGEISLTEIKTILRISN